MSNRRIRTLSALAGVGVWFAGVVFFTLDRYPRFWEPPPLQYERAQALASQNRPKEALATINAALSRIPDNPHYLVFKGYRQLDVDDVSGAEQSFRRVLGVAPDDLESHLGLAEALRRDGQKRDAVRVLDAMPPSIRDNPKALRRRSQLYGQLEAPASALADLSVLLATAPSDPDLLKESVTHAMSLHDYPRAEQLATRLASVPGASSDMLRWVTGVEASMRPPRPAPPAPVAPPEPDPFALLSSGRRAEAEAAFRQVLDEHPDDVRTREAYAWMVNTHHR
jgi:tetratricopeptide (TPR) repeat protein